METFSIPWPCLDLSPKQTGPEENINKESETLNINKAKKSFAQVVNNVRDIPLSQLPQACFKGDRLAISIPETDYLAGMEACKHNLHGRIIWPKGANPLNIGALKNKLTPLGKDLAKWGVQSIGKGFYEFSFSSLEDVRRVRSVASWSLNPGMLKLFAWTNDFNPRAQQNYSEQVWVRLYGLSQEYWRQNIIFAIASSIGIPLCTDSATTKPLMERTFGQFTRVLIDMDLTQTLRYKVLVERKGFAFFVDLEYENLPEFCSNCKIIGHHVGICKKLMPIDDAKIVKEQQDRRKVTNRRIFVPKPGNKGKEVIVEESREGNHDKSTEEVVIVNQPDGEVE
ncbi:hypothetical protein A2U01_0014435, partial [Trifolium medium]|nr:hypothetical protein [Trifolium medium]